MKGPFGTRDEAFAAAEVGEHILARDAFRFRGENYCVMTELEWTITLNNFQNTWAHWETKKEEQ